MSTVSFSGHKQSSFKTPGKLYHFKHQSSYHREAQRRKMNSWQKKPISTTYRIFNISARVPVVVRGLGGKVVDL